MGLNMRFLEVRMFKEIDYKTAVSFLLPRHYSGRVPNIHRAFGAFELDELKAVLTFGKPASPSLCKGICLEKNSKYVYELNRLCRTEDYDKPLSQFVAWCLKQIEPAIIVSYSDSAMNHHGYIYQACNFLYTGKTKERTDKWTPEGKHSRHYNNEEQNGLRKIRSCKYRYVYFAGDKKQVKEWRNVLQYEVIKEYPKGNNSNYVLGNYLKDKIVGV